MKTYLKSMIAISAIAMLVACGGGGSSAPVNQPPTANAGVAQTVKRGAVVTLDATGSRDPENAVLKYSWTLASQPSNSIPYFSDTNMEHPTLTNMIDGTYVASLVVNDGTQNSSAATVTVIVQPLIGAEVAPPRAPVQAEIDYLIRTATDNIPLWLKSPSTFKIVGSPTWSYYAIIGKPAEGAVTVDFDSQNGFGATIRSKAICPANWDNRGFWRNTMQSSLALCVFY